MVRFFLFHTSLLLYNLPFYFFHVFYEVDHTLNRYLPFSCTLFCCFFLLLSFSSFSFIGAQTSLSSSDSPNIPNISWSNFYNYSYSDKFRSGLETPKGNLVFFGTVDSISTDFLSQSTNRQDFWLVKTDPYGTVLWSKTYNHDIYDVAASHIQTDDHGFLLAGQTYETSHLDGFLIKTDFNGLLEWNRTYGDSTFDFINSIISTSDNNYCFVGSSAGTGWIVQINSTGYPLWSHIFPNSGWDEFNDVIQTSDGGFLAVGIAHFSDSAYPDDFLVVKMDSSGVPEWNLTINNIYSDRASSVILTSDGGYAIIGETHTKTYIDSSLDLWLVRINSTGFIEWDHTYGGSDLEYGYSIIQTLDNGFYLLGRTDSFGAGSFDFWLIKTDQFGSELWSQTYGYEYIDNCYSMFSTSDNGLILLGSSARQFFDYSGFDSFVLKIAGNSVPNFNFISFSSFFPLILPIFILTIFIKRSSKNF